MGVVALVVTPWMVALWILAPIVSVLLIGATVAVARRGSPTTDPVADTLVFRYSTLLRWGSVYFALGLIGAITAAFVVHPPQDSADIGYILLAFAMFGSIGGALVWDVLRFRLEVTADGLDCRSPWRARRFIRWVEVADVSFNGPQGWFEVRATDGRTIRLPALVGGLEAFLGACEQRLSPNQLELARGAYIFLGRTFPEERDSNEVM